MNSEKLAVLLISESLASFSGIIRRLETGGCLCRVAASYPEARRMIQTGAFELVLSAIPPRQKALSLLTEALSASRANVFYVHLVEDSCWWLPALRDGLGCFGAPALRPAEFTRLLDQIVQEARRRRTFEQASATTPVHTEGEPIRRPAASPLARPAKAA
jgi:hypothetical protein